MAQRKDAEKKRDRPQKKCRALEALFRKRKVLHGSEKKCVLGPKKLCSVVVQHELLSEEIKGEKWYLESFGDRKYALRQGVSGRRLKMHFQARAVRSVNLRENKIIIKAYKESFFGRVSQWLSRFTKLISSL